MRIVIVGAGIIGCALAYRLSADPGTEVVILDAAQAPGQGASGASFGWLNASFFADAAHFALRRAGLEAWQRLQADVTLPEVTWPGALWWEAQGPEMQTFAQSLHALEYDVQPWSAMQIRAAVPCLRDVPDAALFVPAEGVADTAASCRSLLGAAQALGARAMFGTPVRAVHSGGVQTEFGLIAADQVIVTAGTGVAALLENSPHPIPMLPRPGALLRTRPVPAILPFVLVTPDGEVRQDAQGRIVMPTAVAHQADTATHLSHSPDELAAQAVQRLNDLLHLDAPLEWDSVTVAARPVPQDGLPVVGAVKEGVYVAVMHSGATLAAIVAELAAAEVLGRPKSNLSSLLDPYRPQRF